MSTPRGHCSTFRSGAGLQAFSRREVTVFEPDSPLRDILLDASKPEVTRVYATIYDEAVAAGTAKGVEAGVLRGRVQMLMRLLERRGFELDEARVQQVNGCTDADVLRDWFDRAVTAATLDEVFGPASVA